MPETSTVPDCPDPPACSYIGIDLNEQLWVVQSRSSWPPLQEQAGTPGRRSSMIEFKQGDLFQDNAQALVNPVNCVGVMGKGIALQFKQKFPDNFKEYNRACRQSRVRPGRMFVFNTYRPQAHRYIINFPTKRHWREPSRIPDIEAGTADLAREIRDRKIKSIAIPALGSGLGCLDWKSVQAILESGLQDLENVRITIYKPMPTAPAKNAQRGR